MTEKPKPPPLKEPSEEFLEAISDRVGSIRGECEFCGVTYFDGTSGHFDAGELEGLLKSAKEQPEKFVEWTSGPSFARIDGRQYVYGCPCNAPRTYEDWIWNHRWQISQYLKARSARILQDATLLAEATGALQPIIDLPMGRRVEPAG